MLKFILPSLVLSHSISVTVSYFTMFVPLIVRFSSTVGKEK